MSRLVHVFGPAYLDRVLLVDRPLHAPGRAPLDQSVDGSLRFGEGLRFVTESGAIAERPERREHGWKWLRFIDPVGVDIALTLPPKWPGPWREVRIGSCLESSIVAGGVSWHDDLGGMGAGFASAFGAVLFSALGEIDDPVSQAVTTLLRSVGVRHEPIRVDHVADWTLLVTSGPFGDKLPVGFRGCHAAIPSLKPVAERPCDLRVVASFPNRLAAEALRASGATVRMFAPSTRNMSDIETPVSSFANAIDILCCNRHEWESLADREQVAWQVALLVITDGARGALVRFTTPTGEAGRVQVPAFPRSSPPRDTNRAGEAFASTLVTALLDGGWTPSGGASEDVVETAARRASAASALVLDRARFGFPTSQEVDEALTAGVVHGSDADGG